MKTPAASILVTAFGPFGGREENASSLALRALRRAVGAKIRTRVLPVDAVVAPARLRQALRELRPRALVMLGEAGGCSSVRLERTAWNAFDFRIPDVAGRQLHGRPIHPGSPPTLASSLPLTDLQQLLAAAGHPVEISDDPGRYLCNQLFYTARDWLDRNQPSCRAGFIHLPLESTYPTERVVPALAAMLNCLDEQPP